MTPMTSSGRCLCGAVCFTARLPSKWVAHCHCTRCQRAHGAAFVTWAGFDSDRVEILDPNASLRWFHAPGGGDRAFCATCGSSLFFKSEQWPGELHVARALFIEPIDRAPQVHAYYDTHVDWFNIADDLPTKPDPASGSP
ncbi:MAG: GFA family protein [Pseudomonadota bacterium]